MTQHIVLFLAYYDTATGLVCIAYIYVFDFSNTSPHESRAQQG